MLREWRKFDPRAKGAKLEEKRRRMLFGEEVEDLGVGEGTSSFRGFSRPGWYCDKKGYNTSGMEICHGTSQGARTFGMGLYVEPGLGWSKLGVCNANKSGKKSTLNRLTNPEIPLCARGSSKDTERLSMHHSPKEAGNYSN